ncbi:hypothetical protein ACFQI7_03870 [Paenibacillus allorhizosphaerae]|uniref:DUF2759 family protein n=1 Tax=Paenibacillus allorhizosphaerae TaxID=2849866 RepID=A0ABM8VCL9_9BACL|nr:hypothetical protein [Paenibacillus allorhizosphaerae]CAG7624326.1 hypothetical protein PAECIP111802_01051 [Paenibacillus allorhizosphaerae]
MPATIVLLLCLIVMGSFVSAAFVLFFQRKTRSAFIFLALGLISMFIFYYAIYNGWLALPKK